MTQRNGQYRLGGFRWGGLQFSPEGTPDFSPNAAGFTSFAGGRTEARSRLRSAPQFRNREFPGPSELDTGGMGIPYYTIGLLSRSAATGEDQQS